MRIKKLLMNGIWKENPTFRLVLGMCPTLAITTAAGNGVGMGLATTFVMVFSSLFVSILRRQIPDKIRIPLFVVVIATFATMIEMLVKAFLPALNDSLGIYIPLIVVNCIIFARAESFAYKNPPLDAAMDALGMGIGFTFAITLLASIREIIGKGTLFGSRFMPEVYIPMNIAVQPPGGFIALGFLMAIMMAIARRQKDGEVE